MKTYAAYLLRDRAGLLWASAKAAPAGGPFAGAGVLLLGVCGDAPPALPGDPLTLRGLLEWTGALNGRGCSLGESGGRSARPAATDRRRTNVVARRPRHHDSTGGRDD